MQIGEKINILCKAKGILKKDLAKAMDISASYLSSVIAGREEPSGQLLNKLADYFDVDVEYFLDELVQKNIDEVPGVWNHLPEDIKEWIGKQESKPYLILAKAAASTDIPADQIADLIDALRQQQKNDTPNQK
jgi:transcriptional regulator with XRE-family HTH domain